MRIGTIEPKEMLIDGRRYDKEIFELEMAFIRWVSRRDALRTARGFKHARGTRFESGGCRLTRAHALHAVVVLRCRCSAAT